MSEIVTFAPTTGGSGDEFVIPFPYLETSHVKLYVNGVEDTNKTFPSDGCVKASVAITNGDIIVVKRETPRSALITTLPDTGTLSSDDMNHQSLQAVYVATEAADGLREGLALDEATETYWEGAPTGSNRTIKNVVDPSAAQEAATKGWYDTQLTTHAAAAATSASNAQTSAATAATGATTATSGESTATAAATAATASATAAAADAATATTAASNASDADDEAEAWANTAVSTEVTYPNNGGVNDNPSYSAKHWASQSSTSETTAAASESTALAVAAAATPVLATELLGDEEGYAINYRTFTVAVRDFSGTATEIRNMNLEQFQEDEVGTYSWAAANDYANFDQAGHWSDYGTPQVSYNAMVDPNYGGQGRMGLMDVRNDWQVCGYPTLPGNTTYGNTRVNLSSPASVTTLERMVRRGNPSRYTMNATGAGSEHYVKQNHGRSGVNVLTGESPQFTVIVYYDEDDANRWRYFKIRTDLQSQTSPVTYYSGTIDLENVSSATAGDFDYIRKTQLTSDSRWWRIDVGVPALLQDGDYTVDHSDWLMCDATGDYTITGDGTSTFIIQYAGLHKVRCLGPLSTQALGARSSYQGVVWNFLKAGIPQLSDVVGTNLASGDSWNTGVTFWSNVYLVDEAHYSASGGDDDPILCGAQGVQDVYVYRNASDGNLWIKFEDASGISDDFVDTGVNVPIDDTANGGFGTQLQLVFRFVGSTGAWELDYRIDQGSTVSVTGTTTETTWTSPASYATSMWPFAWNGTGNQWSGILRYQGAITRRIADSEVSKYMNWT